MNEFNFDFLEISIRFWNIDLIRKRGILFLVCCPFDNPGSIEAVLSKTEEKVQMCKGSDDLK